MSERQFSCCTCGTVGSIEWVRDHDCEAVQDVRAHGGRCEDYPCCGHLPGECEPQESFTKAYWQKVLADEDPDYPRDYE